MSQYDLFFIDCDWLFLFQSGIDITKILSAKKKLEAKRKRHEKKNAKKALKRGGVDAVRWTLERKINFRRRILQTLFDLLTPPER